MNRKLQYLKKNLKTNWQKKFSKYSRFAGMGTQVFWLFERVLKIYQSSLQIQVSWEEGRLG
jgi:hypothetical protein